MWRGLVITILAVGCGSGDSPETVKKPPVTTRTLSMALAVAAGSEQHRCQYPRLPPKNWQCFQKCTASACAAGPATKLNDCIDSSCESECSSRGSDTCLSCATAKCATQLSTCSAQKC